MVCVNDVLEQVGTPSVSCENCKYEYAEAWKACRGWINFMERLQGERKLLDIVEKLWHDLTDRGVPK